MLRIMIFDLWLCLAPSGRRLRSELQAEFAAIPAGLRGDMGLTDARLADLIDRRVRAARAAQRTAESHRLLHALNRIAAARGFPPLRWRSGDEGDAQLSEGA